MTLKLDREAEWYFSVDNPEFDGMKETLARRSPNLIPWDPLYCRPYPYKPLPEDLQSLICRNSTFFTGQYGRLYPEDILSAQAEPRLTMLFEGRQYTMSSCKECNVYFIVPNVHISLHNFNIMILNYFEWILYIYCPVWRETWRFVQPRKFMSPEGDMNFLGWRDLHVSRHLKV